MIILILLGGLVFYGVMYLIWQASLGHMDSLAGTLRVLEEMVFKPEHWFFLALRVLLCLAFAYGIYDAVKAARFNAARRRQAREDKNAELVLKYKDPNTSG